MWDLCVRISIAKLADFEDTLVLEMEPLCIYIYTNVHVDLKGNVNVHAYIQHAIHTRACTHMYKCIDVCTHMNLHRDLVCVFILWYVCSP